LTHHLLIISGSRECSRDSRRPWCNLRRINLTGCAGNPVPAGRPVDPRRPGSPAKPSSNTWRRRHTVKTVDRGICRLPSQGGSFLAVIQGLFPKAGR
jgi:hypothetical protein